MAWLVAFEEAEVMKLKVLILFLLVTFHLESATLKDLKEKENVFEAGLLLSGLDNGIHFLEPEDDMQRHLLLGIHGGGSLGYEWVYPLSTLDSPSNLVTYFKWSPLVLNCLAEDTEFLINFLETQGQSYETITILGHSLGGVLLGKVLESVNTKVPIVAHIIASPLAGIAPTNKICEYQPPKAIQENIELYEWRTIKRLDGVFLALPFDPQVVDIKGSIATRLPERYKENKLGHNWSISWVADEISKR